MVHDLTANKDFQGSREFNIFGILAGELKQAFDDLTPSDDEVILTGTALEREHKQYVLDYESTRKNMCDCCGAPIRIKPWDFEDTKPLCPDCDRMLDEDRNAGEDNRGAIDVSPIVKVLKPWDIRDFEQENVIDNVLLWD